MGYELTSNDFWHAPSMVRNIQWMMRTGDQMLALRMASAWAPKMDWVAGCALLTGRTINGWSVEFEVGPDGNETGTVFVVKA